ncbi:MAG: hypothetical protein AB7H96_11915 [Vicinamibacterales bacterium]
MTTAEHDRLARVREGTEPWRRFGPYLSERQWGTVREDYSAHGAAWDSFPHDAARSRAYRWGEDGLAGFSDDQQLLCLGLGLWNGRDPILKERLFGLSGPEGNHGEDVKEIYYYLDALPTHAYLKMLYKYPQVPFPYGQLADVNRSRGRSEPEFELIDTGVFDEDRYFDVTVEYAKEGPEDILMRVRVSNRGPDDAPIWVLPQLWCRNTWSWEAGAGRPVLRTRAPIGLTSSIRRWGGSCFTAMPPTSCWRVTTTPITGACTASRLPAGTSRMACTSMSWRGCTRLSTRMGPGPRSASSGSDACRRAALSTSGSA